MVRARFLAPAWEEAGRCLYRESEGHGEQSAESRVQRNVAGEGDAVDAAEAGLLAQFGQVCRADSLSALTASHGEPDEG